jgi:hypothetical protein
MLLKRPLVCGPKRHGKLIFSIFQSPCILNLKMLNEAKNDFNKTFKSKNIQKNELTQQ